MYGSFDNLLLYNGGPLLLAVYSTNKILVSRLLGYSRIKLIILLKTFEVKTRGSNIVEKFKFLLSGSFIIDHWREF